MISSGFICAVLMAVGLLLGGTLLELIRTPKLLLSDSKLYLDIYVWGLPFVFFYNLSTGIFSGLGDSKTPFYFLALSSISNIAVDILFVHNLGMGVSGVAWATFICQGVSCALALTTVMLRLKNIESGQKFRVFSWSIFKQFSTIAIPSILQQSFISIGNIIIQGVINGFGSGVMAGYSAGVKLNNLVITSFTTLGNGISNYVSQNIGAGKIERIRPGFKAGIKLVWCLCIPLSLLYFIFPEALLRLFLDMPSYDALHSGIMFLRILSVFYFVVSAKLVSDGVLRGSSKMREFMIGTFTDLALRVVLAVILSKTLLGYIGIWCAWPIGWSIAAIISMYFYRNAYIRNIDKDMPSI